MTAKHIEHGKPGVCEHCPVALAVSEALKQPARVTQVEIITGRARLRFFPLSFLAMRFIRRFDNGDNVEPFSFELDKAE